ncbi:MAG: endonuclease MutS2, partial [Nitrospinae bacterium]|nr:endonuclease MutS2 [Nitrospinota bacterium]
MLEKSMALLGWNLVARSLASLALSPFTHEKCLALAPETDFALANRLLDETAEMVSLLDSTESPPMEVFDDIRPVLDEARERILIEPRDALRVMKVLRFARSLSRYIDKRSAVPLLKTKIARLNPLPALLKELERCIDEDGEIKENASPELRQAIRDAWAAKEKLDGVVGKMLSDSAYSEALQDGYHTEREGRVVLPIKAEWRSRVDGIVHDTSGSGVTIYMEPTKIIPLNNQLKINRLRIEREKLKILGQLAGEFIAHETALLGDLEVLSDFDLVYAKARLARTMGARKCPATPDSRVDLRQARNPELILNGREVVPNDIGWDPAIRVIVVSGPNTGGKTVTLKTLGLMSLMVRAGLFLPVREDSAIGFFPEAYADIGDDQNIQLNLSTFSGHVQKIVNILENAAPGALVLLDELGIATDP